MNRVAVISAAVAFSVLSWNVPAHAQSKDDPRKAQAEALIQEGIRLEQDGKREGAVQRFEEAFSVYPSANAEYNLAQALKAANKDVEALRHFRACLKSALLAPTNREPTRQAIADLEAKTGRIAITVDTNADVRVDGEHVADVSAPVDVRPGPHVVEATVNGGKTATKNVQCKAGEVVSVDLRVTTPGGATTEPPKTEERMKAFPPPTGALILGGAGIVGLGLGVGFGLASQAKRSDQENHQCAAVRDAECSDVKSALQRDATISWISYVVGGALVAGGIVWWVAAPRKETISVGLVPSLGPGHAGAGLRGTF